MNDDYLWDGSGEPDPEVERLERLLKRYRTGEGLPVGTGSDDAGSPAHQGIHDRQTRDLRAHDEHSDAILDDRNDLDERTHGLESRRFGASAASHDLLDRLDRDRGRHGGDHDLVRLAPRGARRRAVVLVGSIAAALLLAVAGIALLKSGRLGAAGGLGGGTGWEVVALAGEPKLASRSMSAAATGTLRPGEWIETDADARAEIKIGLIGTARVEPRTRVRLLQAGTVQHRLGLERGTVHARIWAPPRLFFIETPSAVAVDLGCAYTLTVEEDGGSRLRVESGWVAFENEGAESFVPAGAICRTARGRAPGTPYFEDADPGFIEALARFDACAPSPASSPGRAQDCAGADADAPPLHDVDEKGAGEPAIDELLAEARPRDALTLWHLLSRTKADDRARLFDRMAELVPPPQSVTREGILAGDRSMADLWWDELGLGVTSWWRLWKQPGPPKLE